MKKASITKENYYQLFKSTFIVQIILATYSVTDGIVIGNFLGEEALAASTLVLPLFMLITALEEMIAISGANLFSTATGSGDRESANRYFNATLAVSILIGLFITGVILFFQEYIVVLLGATGELVYLTTEYLRVIAYGIVGILLCTCLDFFVRNDGNPNLAMYGTIAFIGFNVVFNIILVGYTDLGIAGAAWATLIGAVAGILILLLTFFTKNNTLSLNMNFSVFDMAKIVKSGVGIATKYMYKMVTILIFNNLIVYYYSSDGVVVYSVIFNVLMVATAIFEGLRDTVQPIVSTYYGEGNNKGIREVLQIVKRDAILLCLGIVLFLETFPQICAYIFGVDDPHMISLINDGVRIYALVIPFITFNEVMIYYYQFIGREKLTAYLMALKGIIVILPCNILLLVIFGLNGFWFGYVLTEIIVMGLIFWLAKRIAIKDNKNLSKFLLLDKNLDKNMVCFCIWAKTDALIQMLQDIESFLICNKIEGDRCNRVILSIEESGLNVIDHNQNKKSMMIEIQVVFGDDITVIIRDNCRRFNPVKKLAEDNSGDYFGLKIIQGMSADFKYLPTIGYNRVILKF